MSLELINIFIINKYNSTTFAIGFGLKSVTEIMNPYSDDGKAYVRSPLSKPPSMARNDIISAP